MSSIVCFHNPEEINGYLSNWHLSDFVYDGVKFSSLEQYMMYKKAEVFDDNDAAEKILNTDDPVKIKSLGRSVKNYNDIVWNGVRQVVVYEGLYAKFSQDENLKALLLGTGEDILAECAVKDNIWGIGLSMTDENRFDMSKWKGQNLLGFSLMEVRNRIKKEG
ncbi:MAG: NADAR family protein [Oscillospiraceae bacterium]|nr:NADAR family protein [Oscillospiraceae bacterium]